LATTVWIVQRNFHRLPGWAARSRRSARPSWWSLVTSVFTWARRLSPGARAGSSQRSSLPRNFGHS